MVTEERCNDELDWGEISHWCELAPGHEGRHQQSEDEATGYVRRPYRIEWD